MSRGRTFAAAACLVALVLSGCSDTDGGDSDPSGQDTDAAAGLDVNEDAIGETLEVSTVGIENGEESTTSITIEEIETYAAGDGAATYGDQGVAVLLSIETTSDDAGPTVRAVDQDDVELADDSYSEGRPSEPSFTEIWQERRSEETSSDDPRLDEEYEGWVTYVYESDSTASIDLRVKGDLEDQEQLTVLGDADAPEAEQQELDDTAVGEDVAAGDFTMEVVDVADPATDLPSTIQPRSGTRVVGFEIEITMEGDNDMPPSIDLYVGDTTQIVAGSDPFFEPFRPGETRTEWKYFYVANRDLPTEIELRSINPSSDSDAARIDLQ